MKVTAGFAQRLGAELDRVRSGGKDALRRFKTPTMSFPVSEGMSTAPTSTDLAPPGRLAAAKDKKEGFGLLRMKNLMLFPNYMNQILAKPAIKERPADTQNEKLIDATIPLDEKSVGTITFDTSKGSTVVQ